MECWMMTQKPLRMIMRRSQQDPILSQGFVYYFFGFLHPSIFWNNLWDKLHVNAVIKRLNSILWMFRYSQQGAKRNGPNGPINIPFFFYKFLKNSTKISPLPAMTLSALRRRPWWRLWYSSDEVKCLVMTMRSQ